MSWRFRPVLTGVVLAAEAALIALGVWQLERREWKLDLIAKVEARVSSAPISFDEALARAVAGEDMEYQPVRIEGVYAHALESHVFGTLDGEAGVYLFTPLERRRTNGPLALVYVNRGFVPQNLRDPKSREGRPEGDLVVEGLFRRAETPPGVANLFRPADQPKDNLWFVRDPLRLAAARGLTTVPYYVDSSGRENPAPQPKGATTRLDFFNRHLEYALTWFGLAAALLCVFIAFSLTRR